MKFTDFPAEVWVDILKHLSNKEVDVLREVFPELYTLQETREMQAIRKIVPFIRKHLPKEQTWHALNCTLMKLFRDIDRGGLSEIVVTCGIRTDSEQGYQLLHAMQKIGRKVPFESVEFKSMELDAWYRRVPVSEWWQGVDSFSKFVQLSKENMKSAILKRKVWIECISTKKCTTLEIQYFCGFYQ